MTHKPSKKKNLFLISTSRITNGRRCSGGLRLFKPNFPPSFARSPPRYNSFARRIKNRVSSSNRVNCAGSCNDVALHQSFRPLHNSETCGAVSRRWPSENFRTWTNFTTEIFKPIYCSKLLANRFDDEVVHLAIGRCRQGVDDGIGAVGRCQSRPGFPLFQRLLVEINITSFIDFRSYNSRTDAPKSTY
jgi:hypothetical protein